MPIPNLPPVAPPMPVSRVTLAVMQKRRAEIRSSAEALRVAEMAWFAEYGSFTTHLKAIGWMPSSGEQSAVIGFDRPAPIPSQVLQTYPAVARMPHLFTSEMIFQDEFSRSGGRLEWWREEDPETGRQTNRWYGFWFSPERIGENFGFANHARQYCSRYGGCSANERSFRAIAVGNLDNDSFLEVWLIDDRGARLIMDDINNTGNLR